MQWSFNVSVSPKGSVGQSVLYFSYGANMSLQKLSQRGIALDHPGCAAVVDSSQKYSLAFCHRGGFATLMKPNAKQKLLDEQGLIYNKPHGVLYQIGKQDFERLKRAETGYTVSEIMVQPYYSEKVTATAFVSKPSLMLNRPVRPTKRYLDLVIEGACQHSLNPEFVSWLQNLEPYEGSALTEEYFETPNAFYVDVAASLILLTVLLYIYMCTRWGGTLC